MNKIYKVVWSKAKHTYVVASEIAKGHTKGETTGKGLKKLAAAMLVAAALLSSGGYTYAALGTDTVTNKAGTDVTVITGEATDVSSLNSVNSSISNINNSISSINNTISSIESKLSDGTVASATKATQDASGNVITETYATKTEVTNLDTRITSVKEYLQNETENNYVSKGMYDRETAVKDSAFVKGNQTVGENLDAVDQGLRDEIAARIGADAAQDKLISAVTKTATTAATNLETLNKNVADGFTTLSEVDKNEAAARAAADTALDTKITNIADTYATKTAVEGEASARAAEDERLNSEIVNTNKSLNEAATNLSKLNTAVVEGFKTLNQADAEEKAARVAADTALDTRITNVKEYLEKQTSDNYVSKDDAAVQDGQVVKATNTIGDNVTLLDAALAKETADRLGADAAQDKVIQQVNDNLVESVNTINKNMADGFNTLSQVDANEAAVRAEADAAEAAARVGADRKLVEAVNSGLSLSEGNVLQKNTTTIDAQGNVTTSKTAAKEMILNKENDNQITLNDKGIKVGTNSSVVDKDGVYTGGDTYSEASAAMSAEGSIKGADGKFTVNSANGTVKVNDQIELNGATGVVKSNGLNVGDGNFKVNSNGGVTAAGGKTTLASDGSIKAADGKFTVNSNGGVKAADGKITLSSDGSVKAADGKFTVNSNGGVKAADGKITLNSDGSVKAANGNFTVNSNGGVKAADGKITLSSDGSVKAADGKFTVDTNGAVKAANGNTTIDSNGNVKTVGTLSAADGSFKVDSNGKITSTGLDAGNGTIQTTGTVQAGDVKTNTLETTGDATISGDLTVKGKLNVDEIDLTKSGIVGDNNVTASTTVAAGEITSYKKATSTKDGSEKESAIDYDENGTSTWAKSTDADGNWNQSTLTVEGNDVKSKVVDSNKNKNESKQTATESKSTIENSANPDVTQKSYITQNLKNILQGIQNGTNATTVNQTETGIKSTATDGKNTASTNLSNKGFNTYATDGTNKTYTKQTATDIKNTAENGTISNSAKDLVNNASENMTNTVGKDLTTTVGGEMKTTVTGDVTEDYQSNMTTTVGKDQKTIVKGSQTNEISGSQTNTIGGSQTTTVTGDSSLTAENINNEAKNKITNKALDVETDASSSIVNKVSNDAGSNTSTQLSYQTTEEMSADGKTASYLRGAAEEKSQLTDGDKKTTIDTIAGQTNTNITDGKNTSNSLQKADQAASSVTDGKSTTVVNQDAKSLASSITAGTKVNNTSSTVDKSEQLIKVDDTHFYAETKTVDKAEEALKSGTTLIDIVKDTKTATVSSAVTDGKTITGISQNAKDINLSAADGTIANSAAEIKNTATKSIADKVGDNVSRTMTTSKIAESVVDGDKSNSYSKTTDKDINIVTDGTNTSTVSQLAGSVNTSLKNGTQSLNNKMTLANEDGKAEDVTKITDTASGAFSSSSQKADSITSTVKDTKTGTISERSQTVSQVQDKVGTTTVTTTDGLTKLTNEAGTHNTQMDFAEVLKDLGVRGNATVDGNTTLGKEGADTTLTVNSTSTFNKDVTMKENATVKKNLTVEGETNLKNTKVDGTLNVTGKSTFNDAVSITKGGLAVTGGATTDTLHVTKTATFDDIVTMKSDLNVGGNVDAASYKVDGKTYIDKDGINANNQVIKNVGKGDISEGSTDAVSGGQLYETNTRVSGLETRMDTVETRVDKLDGRIDKVGANAAAMANLHPLEFDADSKWNVAAAVGNYGNETATAIGAFYRPSENVMVNLSTSMGTGENMYGGGISVRLGQGGNKQKSKDVKAAIAENKELRAKVDDLTARMDALLSVLNPNMSKDFPDVPENHWAYEAVSRLAGNGIVEGYEDGKYHGERQMTRYEMAEIIYNALSKGAKAEKKLVEEFRPELQAMAAQKKA